MRNPPSWILALAGLYAATGVVAQDDTPIDSDTYFYGQSPPVYPVPEMDEEGAWGDAIALAREFVKSLSLKEKVCRIVPHLLHYGADSLQVSLTGGTSSKTGCSGFIGAVKDFPGMCGVRNTDFVSSWPSGVHVGAR
jgi:beta-glucosidase